MTRIRKCHFVFYELHGVKATWRIITNYQRLFREAMVYSICLLQEIRDNILLTGLMQRKADKSNCVKYGANMGSSTKGTNLQKFLQFKCT